MAHHFIMEQFVVIPKLITHLKKAALMQIHQPRNENSKVRRDYYGANFQIEYDGPLGTTAFKTEYVYGKQPGVAASTTITGPAASTSFNTQPTGNLYLRNFEGYYLWLTQRILKTRFEILLAYDVYDPNTDVEENEIGLVGNNTTAGDIKFGTLGYGITCAINTRLKLTIYNEKVTNKATQLTSYMSDLKDDVFTTRLQYRW